PVLSDQVEILSVGPKTLKNWGDILKSADGIIVLGDSNVLKPFSVNPQQTIQIDSTNLDLLDLVSKPETWNVSRSHTPADDPKAVWFPPHWSSALLRLFARLSHPALPLVRFNSETKKWETREIPGASMQDWIYDAEGLSDEEFLAKVLPWTLSIAEGIVL